MSYMGTEILAQATVQQRNARVRVGWGDLQRLLVKAACDRIARDPEQVSAKLVVNQLEEGGPSYKVQKWEAIVDLTQDISQGDEGDKRLGATIPQAVDVMNEVLRERERQVAAGFDAAHDDTHTLGEIAAQAALCMTGGITPNAVGMSQRWVEDQVGNEREVLIKGIALAVAEVERLDRAVARAGC